MDFITSSRKRKEGDGFPGFKSKPKPVGTRPRIPLLIVLMSSVDNRNSSAVKRARTDGGRREDDWTCSSCGNVNFSFRTTCNMRNCTQPRPADHNSKSAPRQMPTPQGYSSSSTYTGSATPASMYLGLPRYGASQFNGTSMPPYDVPLPAGSAYHNIYNNRLAGGTPYQPLQFSGTLPYSGGIYGLPQLMDQLGLRLPTSQTAMGPKPGFFPEDRYQKKDGTRENDWECPNCGNVNFSFRTTCNMRKCNTPKPVSQAANPGQSSKTDVPEGSWKCDKCNNINYPFRTKCNRQNCGAEKPESQYSPSEKENNDQVDNRNSSAVKRARTDGGRREDDWTCSSCGNVNFSFRTTCNMRNCTQPRPADHNSKSAPRQMPTPQGYSSSSTYTGSATPASMYLGLPRYGASQFNGTSMPPYDVPLPAGSAYHNIYNNRLAGGTPYQPLQFSGTLPYSGGIYGLPQLMDQLGLRLPTSQTAMGPKPGFFPEDRYPKKDGTRENDWECPNCGNVNFSFRTTCNMRKCNTPKPVSQAANPGQSSKTDVPEGSWKCDKCNNINYPFRTKCNRQNCGAEKPESQYSPSEKENNDQTDLSGWMKEIALNFR
ncbi:hypothetical protein SSX86_007214 [Deinandra increscens subsp. villosa]|uniref:RanBP2-type domain-containing protein n=1 Tax=Deinandra increscens subsp. villosa TaxID=3103831 RepID=A0AAP0DHH2_9ASTR